MASAWIVAPDVSAKYQCLTLYIGRQHITSWQSDSNGSDICTDSTADSHTRDT